MTVSESRRELTDRFRSSGVESPEVNAEWLLASLLNCSRTELPLRLDESIPDPQLEHLNSQAARRAKREPLQHILGTACFCGLKFQVTPAVLVPRPETEELIELAFEAAKTMPCPVIYDFGTGSGCIAVTLAKRLAKAKVIASDISDEALRLAKANAEQHEVIKRVEFRQADGSALAAVEQVQLIVSNPPYIPTSEIAALEPEVRDYDPRLALDGGRDGLEFYRMLARLGQVALTPGGSLIAEFGDRQEDEIESIFRKATWPDIRFAKDLCGKPRIVIASTGQ
tara:strand:- start:903 stop:1751 length:849 start_codon:yes stop_codon:yes gene_type:complete